MDKLFGAYFFVPTSPAVELNRAQVRAQKEFKRSSKGAQEEHQGAGRVFLAVDALPSSTGAKKCLAE
jgi:hypothetical protein